MKTMLILLLAGLLLAVAAFTRPSEASFNAMVRSGGTSADKGSGLADALAKTAQAEIVLSTTTYKNNVLWAEVTQGGKPVYIGAFGHWFERGNPLNYTKD